MPNPPPWCFYAWGENELAGEARSLGHDVDTALDYVSDHDWLGSLVPTPTWTVLSALATLGSVDLSVARAIEPHLDAKTILFQAQHDPHQISVQPRSGSTWGVYAANPAGTSAVATQTDEGDWTLSGLKLWCSLADRLSDALITAPTEDGTQRLFAVSLTDPSIEVHLSQWNARGLRDISTGSIQFQRTPAVPIGPPGWYLNRPGFSWGGIAVSAIWFGGAAAIAGALWKSAEHRAPDQIALMHLGTCDRLLHSALLCLREAAAVMDADGTDAARMSVLAARTRAHVAAVVESVIETVGHALGAAPLAFDEDHVRRVCDLTLYVRQHHAERDLARLGGLVLPTDCSQHSRGS
ncbi:MAG: acyl-CoA dehydrogenase [Ornithinimicrobium sp.]